MYDTCLELENNAPGAKKKKKKSLDSLKKKKGRDTVVYVGTRVCDSLVFPRTHFHYVARVVSAYIVYTAAGLVKTSFCLWKKK